MSFDGHAANSSGWFIRPRVRETGSTGCAGRHRNSLPIGHFVMATAEHREPCESRGSRTVLGAPEGESPSGDSTIATAMRRPRYVRSDPNSGVKADIILVRIWAKTGSRGPYSITSSARASSVAGTVRPSALAVLRLITNSYLLGACTGRSAGFSPLRIRST